MPARKRKSTPIIGLSLLAILGGIFLAAQMYHFYDPPPPGPPKVDMNTAYDDTWGKLATPVSKFKVTHILVSWEGISGVTPKEKRTKEEARKLIEDIWARYKLEPSNDNWRKLQVQYNEDTGAHNEYTEAQSLVQPFMDTAKTTAKDHARIVESQFGYHLIRRES